MKRFEELVVVEAAGSLAGAYCAKLFADHGASVILAGPSSLPAAQSAYVDQGKERAPTLSSALLATADVLIESSATGPLVPTVVERDELVHVQLSPFGSTGPHAGWRSSDLADYAISGHLYLYGDPDREPLRGPPDQPRYATGLFGFVGAMTALFARERTGAGQVVEVAHTDAMVALHQFTLLRKTMGGDVLRRMGNRFTGQGQPNSIYPCADGWVCVSAPTSDQVERLLDITELAHLLDHPEISSPMDFQIHPAILDDALMPWLAERTSEEIVDLLQAVRVPAAPVWSMTELLADPHLAERDYWRDGGPGVGRVPGPPFRLSRHPWRGEPLSATDLATEAPTDEATPTRTRAADRLTGDLGSADAGPLAGVRVLDLTRVWAGPLATRIFAELGADVVWVEAPWARGPRTVPESLVETVKYYPDNEQGERQWNRNGHVLKYSLGKRSLAIDLATAAGVATFERLVPWADVVIENYSSRVMPHFGLDEHRLHELNPAAIYVTMPGYGRSGPAEHWLAFGSSVDSHAGLSSLVGYADARPWKGGVAWPDPIAGLHAASATLIALWDRAVDPAGRGQTVEVPQFEATVAVVGDQLVAAQTAAPAVRASAISSNRSADAAPQGVYPCAGDDRWIAITVADDEAWRSLCTIAELDADLHGLDERQRHERHDELDQIIAAWTADHEQVALAMLLQTADVVGAPVHDASGVLDDPHFRARGVFATVDQPEVGPFTTTAIPISLSATPATIRRRAPGLGEHNAEVLATLAGLDPEVIEALAADGVIADEPPV